MHMHVRCIPAIRVSLAARPFRAQVMLETTAGGLIYA